MVNNTGLCLHGVVFRFTIKRIKKDIALYRQHRLQYGTGLWDHTGVYHFPGKQITEYSFLHRGGAYYIISITSNRKGMA